MLAKHCGRRIPKFNPIFVRRIYQPNARYDLLSSNVRAFACTMKRQIELEENEQIPAYLKTQDLLTPRHLGLRKVDEKACLDQIGVVSTDELLQKTVPKNILTLDKSKMFGAGEEHDFKRIRSEYIYLNSLKQIASKNKILKSYQGQGFHPTLVPNVILRNVLENPNWYTPYTPYQAEIAQGRLESLLNYQTMITDLTGMDISNASLLCEGTAAAEAMFMCFSHFNKKKTTFLVSNKTYKHVIEVIKTRAHQLGIKVIVDDPANFNLSAENDVFAV
jgi:glycine dehydrogenase